MFFFFKKEKEKKKRRSYEQNKSESEIIRFKTWLIEFSNYSFPIVSHCLKAVLEHQFTIGCTIPAKEFPEIFLFLSYQNVILVFHRKHNRQRSPSTVG